MTDGVLEQMMSKDVDVDGGGGGILLTTAREEDCEVISGLIKGFSSCSILYWGGTAPVVPRSIHKMTLVLSLWNVQDVPPPPGKLPYGNPLETEISILESSLLLMGMIIYTNWGKRNAK